MINRTRLKIDEARIHVLRAGRSRPGDAVLLLHGAMASSAEFDEIISELSQHHPVLAPDLRGMGQSSRVQTLEPWRWVQDIEFVLAHYGVERVHVLGRSLGARVALKLAQVRPDLVVSLCVDAPITHEETCATSQLERTFRGEITPELASQLEAWNGPDWAEARDAYLEYRKSTDLQAYFDLREDLGAVQCPIAVCRGDREDAVHPIAHALAVHAAATHPSWLWIRPNTDFALSRNVPNEFVAFYERFLASMA